MRTISWKGTAVLLLAGVLAAGAPLVLAGCDSGDSGVSQGSASIAEGQPSGQADTGESSGAQEAAADVPAEYGSALTKAKAYSDSMYMSKQAIYDQLVSEYGEKFSAEAAQYAIDNLKADYRANALAKAKSYSDTMYMSKQGIYDQLVSDSGERFTSEEAQYAVDNLQTDYNRNALEKAKAYQETMSMSPDAIRDQLTSSSGEKFTQEEADYAIANL